MNHVAGGREGLEYYPCRYGGSRVLFRGPRRKLDGSFVAVLGGTETYGLFIADPYPALLERLIGKTCVNFGCMNAGLDVFLNDTEVLNAAKGADVTVVQILGAANMSNRFYSVHPRRNDRFLRASSRLTALFPDIDFSQFSFTRHMLGHLQQLCPQRFAEVVEELQVSWFARMVRLIGLLQGRVVLAWFAAQPMPDSAMPDHGQQALFVTREMVDRLTPRVDAVLDLTASDRALGRGTRGMVFAEGDSPAAERLMGPLAHQEAAQALAPVVLELLAATQRPATGAGLRIS
ncbi:DUF6473 family protein [Mesobacterium sp. TK19101]|uniref:DUF6473 family protein n=1 Tax=Mesobacterium hydrothermale TaxID=3111907 RepID=A0ABU6HHV6_9RHOB|nr:DUF6473 family protein [Mesobacterium sp. TK19101]MEC3861501.1 DUF6473 family protein [Mesobacterium sp. TK19101]